MRMMFTAGYATKHTPSLSVLAHMVRTPNQLPTKELFKHSIAKYEISSTKSQGFRCRVSDSRFQVSGVREGIYKNQKLKPEH
jgi:hypothetical protein